MNSRQLHIGGTTVKQGWEILNAIDNEGVDHVGNAMDLSRFESDTFDRIYGSHVLEHFDYFKAGAKSIAEGCQGSELMIALKEWHRVLKQGGELCISVPDLAVLSKMLLESTNSDKALDFSIMRIIYGGHIDAYDFHKVGFTEPILVDYLEVAGFSSFWRTQQFNYFEDTSKMEINGTPISLNIVAIK